MKITKFMLLTTVLLLILIGCSNKDNLSAKNQYTFVKEMVNITPKMNNSINGISTNYVIQVVDFDPTDNAFSKYKEQFVGSSEYKHFYLNKGTKVYNKSGVIIKPEELTKNDTIQFTVVFIDEYDLLATEVREVN